VTIEQRDEALADHAGRTEHAYLELVGHCAGHCNKSGAVVDLRIDR
jgi:hypothetical protein